MKNKCKHKPIRIKTSPKKQYACFDCGQLFDLDGVPLHSSQVKTNPTKQPSKITKKDIKTILVLLDTLSEWEDNFNYSESPYYRDWKHWKNITEPKLLKLAYDKLKQQPHVI